MCRSASTARSASTNDAVRGEGSFAAARTAMDNLAAANFGQFKISVVVTRENVTQLDSFSEIAESYGAQLRLTRFRPSGRGVETWDALHPTADQQRMLYHWLLDRPDVLTGDSFFHLSALGQPLDGLNLCGAGRVVCLIDPVGDVYACPFVIDKEFLAGNVRDDGGFAGVWRESDLFLSLREPQSAGACASCGSYDACQGGCMAAKFFTGLPLDGPDPECVFGHGEDGTGGARTREPPEPGLGHSKVDRNGTPIPVPTPVRFRTCPRLTRAGTRRGAARRRHLARGRGHRARVPAGRSRRFARTARAASARSTPTPGSPSELADRLAGAAARCGGGAGGGLRGQWRARRHFPGRCWSTTTCWPSLLVELVRSARAAFAGVVLISAHGGNHEGLSMVAERCRAEGDPVLIWTAARAGRRCPCGPDRDVADAGHRRRRRCGPIWPKPAAPNHWRRIMPRLRAEGVQADIVQRRAGGSARVRVRPRARALLDAMTADLADAVAARWPRGRAGP